MKLMVELKSGEQGMVVGYAPGRKGNPLAIVIVDGKFRAVKLRQMELVGFAKVGVPLNMSAANPYSKELN